MRWKALKSYDESNGQQTSSEYNSLAATILSKMKWKKIQQETRYLREGRCGKKAGGAEDKRRQLKLKLRKPPHAWMNMIYFWRQAGDFETYQRKFLCIFLHKMKARHYKEQCGRCSSASFRYKGYHFFSFENCICYFADWYRSLVACLPATHTQKKSGLHSYIQHQIN